jgi:hypothetical protein
MGLQAAVGASTAVEVLVNGADGTFFRVTHNRWADSPCAFHPTARKDFKAFSHFWNQHD